MSSPERNKGSLTPVTKQEVLSEFPNADFDDLRWDTNDKYLSISGTIYKVDFEVNGDTDSVYFSDVHRYPNGQITFHSIHHNGSQGLEEVIDDALLKLQAQQ